MLPCSFTSRITQPRRRGHAVVETALMMPWIIFLFIGVFDFGFYAYALINVQNAARLAALHTSSDTAAVADQAGACGLILLEMDHMPNKSAFSTTCSSAPLVVTAVATTVGGASASEVAVTYQTLPLIPIPGILSGQMTITRRVTMRVAS